MVLDKSEFGNLVKAYRKQRGWTQAELAERWEHSRGYVAQIERGQRKLDSVSQVVSLADILDIPSEKLEAIGRGIPERKLKGQVPAQIDDAVLQILLTPGSDMVRLAYTVWLTHQHPLIEKKLRDLILNLSAALTMYRGQFVKPAQQLLAYTHQMMGKIVFDRLDCASASGHFSEMIDLGRELNDADIIALGMTRQGDVLRKQGRYETALRCFDATKPFVAVADPSVQGIYHINTARTHYFLGDERNFLRSIHSALDIAAQMKENNEGLAYWFNYDVVLQFQASGYTALQKPENAIEIYKRIDQLPHSRLLRDRGAYTIEKARAYLEYGDLEEGTKLALKGLQLALAYRSRRHIARLDATYNRFQIEQSERGKKLDVLRDALIDARRKQVNW